MSYTISPLRLCRGERLSLSETYQMLRSEINLLMHWSTYMAQYQYQERQQTVVCVDCLFPCIGHHFLGNNNKDEGGVSSIWNEREARSRNNKLIVPILGSLLTCTNVHAILRPHPVSPRRYNCIKLERDEGEQAKQRVQQHQQRRKEGSKAWQQEPREERKKERPLKGDWQQLGRWQRERGCSSLFYSIVK